MYSEKGPETPETPVVILIHGIRTAARWQSRVAAMITEALDYKVLPIKYGYFDVIRFLLPMKLLRANPINVLQNQIRSVISNYPNRKIIVFAHSFGTFAITEVLKKNPDIMIDRLIMCGSVVPANFDWARVSKQVRSAESRIGILNECGTKDVWPVLAQSLTWGYGATGTFGFGDVHVTDRFHDIRHSDYFDTVFIETNWIPYLRTSEIPFSEADRDEKPVSLLFNLARFPIKYFIAILVAIALLGMTSYWMPIRDNQINHVLENISSDIESEQYLSAKAHLSVLDDILAISDQPEREKALYWLAKKIPIIGREVSIDMESKRSLNIEVLELVKKYKSNPLRDYFSESDLSGIDLAGMDFSKLQLYTLNFAGSFLVNSYFEDSKLSSLNFEDTRLRYATFHGATFENVDLRESDWFNALGIDPNEFSENELRKLTKCPSDISKFKSFHDEIYYIKFEQLDEDLQSLLLDNWTEISKKGGICQRIPL